MNRYKVMTVLGTRPDAIKLAPVIKELDRRRTFSTVHVNSGQHDELLRPLISLFRLRIDHQVFLRRRIRTPDELSDVIRRRLAPIIAAESPSLVLVHGDTSTAMGATAAAAQCRIPVAHVEAGLRSGDDSSPFPEELYRKHISKLASYHFAPTVENRSNLLREGVPSGAVFVTGNTVVDSLREMLSVRKMSKAVRSLLHETRGMKRIVLTMHRRENLGRLAETFKALQCFVREHKEVCLIFPVHLNPAVRRAAKVFAGCPRVACIPPMRYDDFVQLARKAWVIVTDSGGIQEEASTLGKPVLLFRANTERPEALNSCVTLAGESPERLIRHLADVSTPAFAGDNPFGNGGSSATIADLLEAIAEKTT